MWASAFTYGFLTSPWAGRGFYEHPRNPNICEWARVSISLPKRALNLILHLWIQPKLKCGINTAPPPPPATDTHRLASQGGSPQTQTIQRKRHKVGIENWQRPGDNSLYGGRLRGLNINLKKWQDLIWTQKNHSGPYCDPGKRGWSWPCSDSGDLSNFRGEIRTPHRNSFQAGWVWGTRKNTSKVQYTPHF